MSTGAKSMGTKRVKQGRRPRKKLTWSRANRARVLRCAEKLGTAFLDYDRALWLIAPSGKVFDFGAMQSHLNFYEYGTKRGTLIREALAKAHPHSQPEFYPCPKSDAYLDALKLMEGDLLNCGDPECAFCELRGCLPATSESLMRLIQFYFQREFSD